VTTKKTLKKNLKHQVSVSYLLACLFVVCFLSGEAMQAGDRRINQEPLCSTYFSKDSFPVYPRIYVNNEWVIMLPDVFIWGGDPALAEQKRTEWNRLRNAVYVTYPFARQAGVVMRDVQQHLKEVSSNSERRKYIKSREKELKEAFGDQISELSIYQGKVLMKLIHRQTGEDCYEIIKEMKGGLTARLYQTILFFVGSDLKQSWEPDTNSNDRLIESFVREMSLIYYPEDITSLGHSGL